MLRVTVEMVPHGDESRARPLAEMLIANDGTGTGEQGNYQALLKGEYTDGRGIRLTGFNRLSQSVWTLVGSLLKGLGHTKHSPKLMEKVEGDPHDLARRFKT